MKRERKERLTRKDLRLLGTSPILVTRVVRRPAEEKAAKERQEGDR